MNIPKFLTGETLTAAKLNALADAIKEVDEKATSAMITDVEGAEFSRDRFGTTLRVPQITAADGGDDNSDNDTPENSHPFKVSLSVDNSGKFSLKMKGGRWHGNGCGNYLGISYLEEPAEEMKGPPEKVQPGEDLFFIPDCVASGTIGNGQTFAVCLYAPNSVAGKVKSYPWAYLKEISSLKEFREELLTYAYSTVAIVGVWKLDSKDGVKYLKGAPGQMLFGDFYYKNNQIFSTGKFGWSRIEGVPYGFRVAPGLIHVNPNLFSWARGEGKIGKIAPAEADTSTLNVKIPRLSLETEVNEEKFVLTGFSSENTPETGVTVDVDIPYYTVTHATGSVPVEYTLTETSEHATASASSEYVQSILKTTRTLSATPNNAEPWTETVVTNIAPTTGKPTINYTRNKYALKTSGTQNVVTSITATNAGTKRTQVTLPIPKITYAGESEEMPTNIKSVELKEEEPVEYMVEGELKGGIFEVKEGNEADAEKIGIKQNDTSEEFNNRNDFWVSTPGVDFKLEKEKVEKGAVVAIRLTVDGEEVSTAWELIEDERMTASEKTSPDEETPNPATRNSDTEEPPPGDPAEKPWFQIKSGSTHQFVKLTIEQRFETEEETVGNITGTGAIFGVKAEIDTDAAAKYTAVFPVGMIFFDKETAAPVVQPLCSGAIEYTPPLALILNDTDKSETGCEYDPPPGVSEDAGVYADNQLKPIEENPKGDDASGQSKAAKAAFTASAHGLESGDFVEVWEILEG